MISSSPEATASSTTYWMVGLSTSGSISFGCALVAGRKRVPRPAAGKTATLTGCTAVMVPDGQVATMIDMSDEAFFRDLTRGLETRGRLALATVVETRGSG